ncbi:MAG TPA: hypothetical protein VFV52_07275 [Bacilli bacterium]|nr:hypothetical protein [Bacilli bacterium]
MTTLAVKPHWISWENIALAHVQATGGYGDALKQLVNDSERGDFRNALASSLGVAPEHPAQIVWNVIHTAEFTDSLTSQNYAIIPNVSMQEAQAYLDRFHALFPAFSARYEQVLAKYAHVEDASEQAEMARKDLESENQRVRDEIIEQVATIMGSDTQLKDRFGVRIELTLPQPSNFRNNKHGNFIHVHYEESDNRIQCEREVWKAFGRAVQEITGMSISRVVESRDWPNILLNVPTDGLRAELARREQDEKQVQPVAEAVTAS